MGKNYPWTATSLSFTIGKFNKKLKNIKCEIIFNDYIDAISQSGSSTFTFIPDTNIQYMLTNSKTDHQLMINEELMQETQKTLFSMAENEVQINEFKTPFKIVEGTLKEIYKNRIFSVVVECANCFPKGQEKDKVLDLLHESFNDYEHTLYTDKFQFIKSFNERPSRLGVLSSYKYSDKFKVGRCMRVMLVLYNQKISDFYKIEYPKNPKIFIESSIYTAVTKKETDKIVENICKTYGEPIKVFVQAKQYYRKTISFSNVNDPKYFKDSII